jgi:outer membrane protein
MNRLNLASWMAARTVHACVAIGGALCMASGVLAAQELKIGYVNSDRVMKESAPARAAAAKLEAEFSKRDKELGEMAARLKASAEKLEKDGPAMAESEREKRQRELVEQDRDLTRKRRELQADLNQRRNDELQALVDRANRVIRQISEQEKYDLILQDAVIAGPRVDITDKVIKALGASAAAPK